MPTRPSMIATTPSTDGGPMEEAEDRADAVGCGRCRNDERKAVQPMRCEGSGSTSQAPCRPLPARRSLLPNPASPDPPLHRCGQSPTSPPSPPFALPLHHEPPYQLPPTSPTARSYTHAPARGGTQPARPGTRWRRRSWPAQRRRAAQTPTKRTRMHATEHSSRPSHASSQRRVPLVQTRG